jgi:triacylglycerol lipase
LLAFGEAAYGVEMVVLLAHGFPGFVNVPVIGDYFQGVPELLRTRFRDVTVLTPMVDPFGDTSARAGQLAASLPASERVHIIAHSAGGLDARYLASPGGLNMGDRVASITTIGTPHHGSQIADLLAGPADVAAALATQLQGFAHALGAFTTGRMAQFNHDIPDAPGVAGRSYGGVTGLASRGVLGSLFLVSYPLVLTREGPNDGWVSVESSKWDTFAGTVEADHAEEIGHELSVAGELLIRLGHPVFDHLAFYEGLVADLGATRV